MEQLKDKLKETKEKLDSVGCGMCLAKWTQTTLHLHNGTTHSCHHPAPHKIPMAEIKRNPSALHNTRVKKEYRRQMLNNKRPNECDYCWNVEDNSDSYSDRIYKSEEPWSKPHFDEIVNSDWRSDFNPKYVEVSFSNNCNFKCGYCGPEYSSTWVDEIKKHGAYPTSQNFNSLDPLEKKNTLPIPVNEDNPYVDAFWDWWPELYPSMDTFRITGGEPLLSKDTYKVLDYIINAENPNTDLKLSINSNLGVDDKRIDKMINKMKTIIDEGRVKELIIYTSCDTYGEDAEFIRYGLNFDKLFSNIEKILEQLPQVTVVIMSAFNVFSIFNYEKLIKKVYDIKVKHFNTRRYWNSPLILDTSYIRYPSFLSFRILKGFLNTEYFDRCIKFMKFQSTYRSLNSFQPKHISDTGFQSKEIEKLVRLKDVFVADELSEISFENDMEDFKKYIEEYDKRRGTDFKKTFPLMWEWIYENNV
jgi:organic radical activating enzyme